MAITVKHSGNAAPMAAGAFAGSAKKGIPKFEIPGWGGGGGGGSRGRALEQMAMTRPVETTATKAGFRGPTKRRGINLDGTINLSPQEMADRVSGKESYLEKKKIDNLYDLEQRKRDAADAIATDKLKRGEYDYKEGMDRREFDYKQNAARVAARDKNQEDLYDYDFTDQQRQRFDQLNQAADEVRNSGEFKAGSPEQMDALSQIEKLQDEIKPTRRLKEKKQDPLALAQSKIFTDPVSGNRGFIKKNGDLEFIKQEPDPAVQQADKQKAEFVSLYEKIATEPFKETKMVDIAGKMMPTTVERPKTDEEIKAEVDRAIKIKQDAEAYFNPDAAAPAGKVVAPNGDTSYVGDTGLAIQKTERLFNSLRGMDGRKLSPEAKAVLNLGEDSFYAAAQEKANARGMSVNDYISIVMKGLTQ